MSSCNTCFEDTLAKCNDTIRVYAQLPALPLYSSYRWVITDKFRNKYEGSFTPDPDGFFDIPVDELPEGLLTQYSGSFSLQVYGDGCKPVSFKIAGEYDCATFDIQGGTFVKDTIGCAFTCVAAPAGQSAMVPFTDAESVSITWAPYLSLYGNNPVIQVFHETSPGIFTLVSVEVQTQYTDGVLTAIEIDNGGEQTGYVVIS